MSGHVARVGCSGFPFREPGMLHPADCKRPAFSGPPQAIQRHSPVLMGVQPIVTGMLNVVCSPSQPLAA